MVKNNLDTIFSTNITNFSSKYLDYIKKLITTFNVQQIEILVKKIIEAREKGSNIFIIGNGGSASTASHYANDISIGSKSVKKPFKAISLTDNQAIITAIANDYGYDQIFVKQLQILAKQGDLIISISASGNSKNIIKALEYGNRNNIDTISITGFDGGQAKKISKYIVHIETNIGEYGPVEDLHMILAGLLGSYFVRLVDSE